MKYVKYGHGKWTKATMLIFSGDGIFFYDFSHKKKVGINSDGEYIDERTTAF